MDVATNVATKVATSGLPAVRSRKVFYRAKPQMWENETVWERGTLCCVLVCVSVLVR
jgi:hypothetical protein